MDFALLSEYESELLDIIDNAADIPRSDLQGIVSAFIRKVANG